LLLEKDQAHNDVDEADSSQDSEDQFSVSDVGVGLTTAGLDALNDREEKQADDVEAGREGRDRHGDSGVGNFELFGCFGALKEETYCRREVASFVLKCA